MYYIVAYIFHTNLIKICANKTKSWVTHEEIILTCVCVCIILKPRWKTNDDTLVYVQMDLLSDKE